MVHAPSLLAFHLASVALNPTQVHPRNSSNSQGTVSPLVMGLGLSKFLQGGPLGWFV
ncbi:hypothetical protein M405DRAFT_830800 [Rhizopogon salebrosus TDB-379]|nr:hypothetical protein M405DRAFT_830800 [Rhizopogon salebrosus TDB-379]